MTEQSYASRVRSLSDRIVAAQKGIRVLDAIKWGEEIQAAFFAADCRDLPRVDAAYYQRSPLAYDPADARAALREIQRDIAAQLGRANPAGQLMDRMCDEYLEVLELLAARGTPQFGEISAHLYGSASDAFHAGGRSRTSRPRSTNRCTRSTRARSWIRRRGRSRPARRSRSSSRGSTASSPSRPRASA